MATRYFRANSSFAGVGTGRYVFVPTITLTQIIMSTGYTGLRIYNSGSNTLVWGDSSISTNSGNFLFPAMSREFDNCMDSFSFFMTADSANSYISITEYN